MKTYISTPLDDESLDISFMNFNDSNSASRLRRGNTAEAIDYKLISDQFEKNLSMHICESNAQIKRTLKTNELNLNIINL